MDRQTHCAIRQPCKRHWKPHRPVVWLRKIPPKNMKCRTQTAGFLHDSWESRAKGKDEWLTPRHIVDALGPFDLDPCSPIDRPWPTAARHYTILDNGLSKPWAGRIWLNPPYGRATIHWLHRLKEHGNGIALVFARTETALFFRCIWPHASAVLFFKGRLAFCHVDGSSAGHAGAPSCLIAYGKHNADTLKKCNLSGVLVEKQVIINGEVT